MFHFLRPKKILVTHNGKFHADDIFACATLQLALERQGFRTEIVRTRDAEIIKNADIVFDVGGIYDHEQGRYDHHQKGGAGEHDNGIPYASFGLVWKHYGDVLTENSELTSLINHKLVQPVDADDNGVQLYECVRNDIGPRTMQSIFYTFRPTWKEGSTDSVHDERFKEMVTLAKKLILREIKVCADVCPVRDMIRSVYEGTDDPSILLLTEGYPWEPFIDEYEDIIYVVYPRNGMWRVGGVPTSKGSYTLKKQLPHSWAGLRGAALCDVTGIDDAVFCHNARFLAVAQSQEGALRLAQLALKA